MDVALYPAKKASPLEFTAMLDGSAWLAMNVEYARDEPSAANLVTKGALEVPPPGIVVGRHQK